MLYASSPPHPSRSHAGGVYTRRRNYGNRSPPAHRIFNGTCSAGCACPNVCVKRNACSNLSPLKKKKKSSYGIVKSPSLTLPSCSGILPFRTTPNTKERRVCVRARVCVCLNCLCIKCMNLQAHVFYSLEGKMTDNGRKRSLYSRLINS